MLETNRKLIEDYNRLVLRNKVMDTSCYEVGVGSLKFKPFQFITDKAVLCLFLALSAGKYTTYLLATQF